MGSLLDRLPWLRLSAARYVVVKRGLLAVAGGAVVGALLLTAVLVALDRGHLQRPLLKLIEARTGRPVRVERLSIRLRGGPPRIVAEQVVIGAPAWMPGRNLAEIGTLTLTLRPTPRHPLRLRTLAIENAVIRPHRDGSGRANWRLREKPGSGGGGLLPIELLQLADVRVELLDEPRHLEFSGHVSTRKDRRGDPLHLDLAGDLNGRPVEAALEGEPLDGARADRPWTFSFREASSGTRLTGTGAVLRPFDFDDVDIRFEASGEDLRDLYYLVGVRLPDTGRYTGSGRLERRGKRLAFHDLRARTGESDLDGSYVSEAGGKRPEFTAELHSRHARSRDLGARAAGRATPRDGPPKIIPDARIPLAGLRIRDGVIHYRADTVAIGPATLRDLSATIRIEGGVLTVTPLTAGVMEGRLHGGLEFDARPDAPEAKLDLRFDELQVGDLFQGKGAGPPLEGRLNGSVRARGKGDSLKALAGSADGYLEATLGEGAIRESLAGVLGFDLRGLGLALARSEQMIPLRCARMRFVARDGQLGGEQLVIDTRPVVIRGSGGVDLKNETLDLEFRGQPKSMRLRLRTPLLVRGTLAEPAPRLESRHATIQGGAAVALGALVAPLAAAAAFVDPGRASDLDCDALVAASGP